MLFAGFPVDAGHFGEGQFEGVGTVAAVALGFQGDVELMGDGEAGEAEAHPFGFVEGDPHVFDEVFDEEAGVEIVGHDAGAEVVERPAPRCTGADRLQHGGQVETRLVAVEEGLADPHHVVGDDDLVGHFGVLAGTGAPLVDDGFAHRVPAGVEGVADRFVAAEHDREAGFLGTDITAGDGSVDAQHIFGLGRVVDFDRERRFAGGHVDENVARFRTFKGTVIAEEDFADIAGEADDGEDDVGVFGHFLGGTGPLRTLSEQAVGLGLGAGVGGEGEAGGEQVAGHGVAHDAGADPA